MRWDWFIVLATLCVLLEPGSAEGRRHPPNLMDEDGSRKVVRFAECTFGGQARELHSTWFADLGPPFGVMYCIKCECLPVQKKKRYVAKVMCKNIKNECPKPSCDEPVLHPGRCCKVCPGDVNSPDKTYPESTPLPDEEDKDARHFAAILTSPHHPPAAIRFVLRRWSLHFAVEEGGSSNDLRARSLQIIDPLGNALQEVPLAAGGRMAGRVCGVWRRLPRSYRKLLREGKLTAALLWPREIEPQHSGLIISHAALSTEMFSVLLEADSNIDGWGGTAAISATGGAASSLHISVFFKGLPPSDIVEVLITHETVDKNNNTLKENCQVIKISKDINIVELSSPVTVNDLRFLARGRLFLSLRAVHSGGDSNDPQLLLRGPALPRLACDLFYTPLAAKSQSTLSISSQSLPTASGVAWCHMNRDGELLYTVQVDELNMLESPMITLVDEANKRPTELKDLTHLRDGLANGSLDRVSPRLLESLYSGDLVVNVATHSDGSIVRGRLTSRPVADVHDLSGPVLMKRPNLTQPANLIGLAWISVDYECNLQWEVSLAGSAAAGLSLTNLDLWLDMRPILAPGAPVISKKLGSLEFPEGVILALSLTDLQHLGYGACEVLVKEPVSNTTVLRATLRQIPIFESCFQYNEVPAVPNYPSHPNSPSNHLESNCFHSERFYQEGNQWTSNNEPCTMCSCAQGKVSCDAVRCPRVNCTDALIRPGECCPICSNSTNQDVQNTSSTKGCLMAGQFHSVGQTWYPYLPPEGFDTCTTCMCDPRTLLPKCLRNPCPVLTCPPKLAHRLERKDCCLVCPEPPPDQSPQPPLIDANNCSLGVPEGVDCGERLDYVRDGFKPITAEQILAGGGCHYPVNGPLENGHVWHPVIHSHGEQKCVVCSCNDGEVKCYRKRCTPSKCNSQFSQAAKRKGYGLHKGALQEQAPPDPCCQQSCRRKRRHPHHFRSVRT